MSEPTPNTPSIADLEKKSVLAELVYALKNFPEIEPMDPREHGHYDPKRFVSDHIKKASEMFFASARGSAPTEEDRIRASKFYIDKQTGKLSFYLTISPHEFKAIDKNTPINPRLITLASYEEVQGEATKEFEKAFSAVREPLLNAVPEYQLLKNLLGKDAMATANLLFSQPSTSCALGPKDASVEFTVRVDVDMNNVDLTEVLKRSVEVHKKLNMQSEGVLRSRIGIAADDIHDKTKQLNDEQLGQFLAALTMAVLMRREPTQVERQKNTAQKTAAKIATLSEQMGDDLTKLKLAAFMAGAHATADNPNPDSVKEFLSSPLLQMNLEGPTGIDVLLQVLGQQGVANLPPALQAAASTRLLALNEGNFDTHFNLLAPAKTTDDPLARRSGKSVDRTPKENDRIGKHEEGGLAQS